MRKDALSVSEWQFTLPAGTDDKLVHESCQLLPGRRTRPGAASKIPLIELLR